MCCNNICSYFDFICLLETKCNSIDDYKIFIMPRKSKSHKYGGIHGISILVKNAYASNCSVVTYFWSESVVWLHISRSVIGYKFILGAVYLPHEASTYYCDDVLNTLLMI